MYSLTASVEAVRQVFRVTRIHHNAANISSQSAILLAVLTLAFTLFSGVVPAADTGSATTAVFEKVRERLGLMQSIAAWKAMRKLPVEDIEREAVVVQSSIEGAKAVGIYGPSAKVFFEEQIAAAKEIQSCWMERWAQGTSKAPQTASDLINEIRPRLIQLGAEILKNIARTLKDKQGQPFNTDREPAFIATVDIDCLSEKSKGRIYQALSAVRLIE